MTSKKFKKLYERCVSGKSTPEEQRLFEDYKDQFDLSDIPWTNEMGDYESKKEKLFSTLNNRIVESESRKTRIWYWSAAASILFILLAGLFSDEILNKNKIDKVAIVQSTIQPGRNKAILITSDGKQTYLEDSQDSLISVQSQMRVLRDKSNRLIYQKGESINPDQKIEFNTLVTPRGGQYELVLSDGTKVWMNADSRLKYPVSFIGKERVVELSGEAYFEVKKMSGMPFRVVSDKKTIEVLGTHFNVHAYPEDLYRTTLLEGSVRLKYGSGLPTLLTPGEQATLNANQEFHVTRVSTKDAIAWKNGIFLFKNEPLRSVMRQISRWYDIEYVFQGNLDQKRLGGTVSRYTDIKDLLKTIELTESIHFKIDGRRITVMP
jgi:transmembrane sensor